MLFVLFSLSFVLFPSLFLSLFPSVSLTVSWSNSPALLCIWISVGLWQTQHTCQSCNTNTQTHTHTWLYSSQSLSLSLSSVWLTVWPARGINALLWRCRVWLSLPACHIHLEREGKGKLGGVWRLWARKTHTTFPGHVVRVNSVCVCVLGAVCPRETPTASGWVRGTVPQWRRDSSELKLHHTTLLLVLPQ